MVNSKASKVVSKTKLLATRRKTATPAFKAKTNGKPGEVLLGQLMQQYLVDKESAPSYASIMSGLGMNDRNTPWRKAWKDMLEKGLIEQQESSGGVFTTGVQLTEQGIDEASTDELKEVMSKTESAKATTNEELHERIKAKLMNERGKQIFDLLLKYEAMSRHELAHCLGISDTGAYFSYALQELKDLGYAEDVREGRSKRACLTEKSFVTPRDTPLKYDGPSGRRQKALQQTRSIRLRRILICSTIQQKRSDKQ